MSDLPCPFYTVKEVVQALGGKVTPQHVYNLIERGVLKALKTGRKVLIYRDSLAVMLDGTATAAAALPVQVETKTPAPPAAKPAGRAGGAARKGDFAEFYVKRQQELAGRRTAKKGGTSRAGHHGRARNASQ